MSVYRAESGRWAVRIEDYPDPRTGARRRRSIGTFRLRKDAEAAERAAIDSRDRGTDIVAGKVTVSELLERYLEDRAHRTGEKTLERYHEIRRLYLEPHVGGVPLAKLRPVHVSDMVAVLLASGGQHGAALSPRTVGHAYSLLNAALAWAVRMQILDRNVVGAVECPRPQRRFEPEATSAATIRAVLAACESSPWPWMRRFIVVALSTGARRGELAALRWDAVDLEGREVTFRSSLSQTRAGVKLKGTKTGISRSVPLAPVALTALREQLAAQGEEKRRAGIAYRDQGFVFATGAGDPISPMLLTDSSRKLCRRAGVSGVRLHDLRHALASWLLVTGVDAKTTASILGHTTPTTTLRVYAHLIAGAKADAIGKLEILRELSEPGTADAPTGPAPVGGREQSPPGQAFSASPPRTLATS